jgi:hypothetical protein
VKATWPPGSSVLGMWQVVHISLLTGQDLMPGEAGVADEAPPGDEAVDANEVAVVADRVVDVASEAGVAEDCAAEPFAAAWQAWHFAS